MTSPPVKEYTNAASGIRGVYPNGSKWVATICFKYKQVYLGYFDTKEEAVKARKSAEREYYPNLRDITKAVPVPGFEGYYVCRDGVVIGRHGRPLASWIDKDGYVHSNLALGKGKDSPRRRIAQHVLVCLAYHGPKPTPAHEVRHLDGSKTNNDPSNVCWSTHLENMQDRYIHGTMPYGPRKKKEVI